MLTSHLKYYRIKILVIIFGLVFSMLTSGCVVYKTQLADVPLISKKKELRIDGGISLIPAYNATISYGLTDKIAIQGFGYFGIEERYYFHVASGLFKKINNNKIVELYSGVGYGHGITKEGSVTGWLEGDYQLYFVQLNYGKIAVQLCDNEIGVGVKAGYLHSNLTKKSLDYESYVSNHYVNESILLEPTVFIRFGKDRLKLSLKVGSSLIFKMNNSDETLPFSPLDIGIGLNYRY